MRFEQRFERATDRAKEMKTSMPRAVSARYDRHSGRIVVELNTGLEVGFRPERAQGSEKASPAELERIEISPSGYGIHFPKLDADLNLPSLIEGVYGTKRWMAARLGRLGGCPAAKEKSRRPGGMGSWAEGQETRNQDGRNRPRKLDVVFPFASSARYSSADGHPAFL